MPKFTVFAQWKMCGDVEVEADSLEEAIEKVYANDDNEYSIGAFDGEYVDDSFQVDKAISEDLSE